MHKILVLLAGVFFLASGFSQDTPLAQIKEPTQQQREEARRQDRLEKIRRAQGAFARKHSTESSSFKRPSGKKSKLPANGSIYSNEALRNRLAANAPVHTRLAWGKTKASFSAVRKFQHDSQKNLKRASVDSDVLRPVSRSHSASLQGTGRNGAFSTIDSLLPGDSDIEAISQLVNTPSSGNTVVVTANAVGEFTVYFYANSYLGYIDPETGDLLDCRDYEIEGRSLAVPLQDCVSTGNLSDIRTFEEYPLSLGGGRIRSGSDFYYPQGEFGTQLMKSSGNAWYHENGQTLRGFSGTYYYANGIQINETSSLKDSTGKAIYNSIELRYRDGGTFAGYYFSGNLAATYTDGSSSHLVATFAGSRTIAYPRTFSSFTKISTLGSDQKIVLKYSSDAYLKVDRSPYYGDVYYEDGRFASTVNQVYRYVLEDFRKSGHVMIDADYESDFVGVFQYDDDSDIQAVYAVIQNRIPAPAPENPLSPTATPNFNNVVLNWIAPVVGAENNQSYRISITQGPVGGVASLPEAYCGGDRIVTVFPLPGQVVFTRNIDELGGQRLLANTSYGFRICGINELGVASEGVVVYGTTLSNPPPIATADSPLPDGLRGVANPVVGLTNLTLNIQAGLGGGPTAGYVVRPVVYVQGVDLPTDCTGGTDVGLVSSTLVTGLSPGTTYALLVCAYNPYGEYAAGPAYAFQTTDVDAPSNPFDLITTQVGSTTISLAWNSTSDFTAKYKRPVSYRVSLDGTLYCARGFDVGTNKQYTITAGLNPGGTYPIRVCAISNSGEVSPNSPLISVTTKNAQPAEIRITAIENKVVNGKLGNQISFIAPRARRKFMVQSSPTYNGPATVWTDIPGSEQRSTVINDSLSYFDSGVGNAAMRFYQIRESGTY